MVNNQDAVGTLTHDDEGLTPEEQVWFPNMLRYLHNCGIGDGKKGQLQRARILTIEDFLPAADSAAILEYALGHEADFQTSTIVRKEITQGEVSTASRQSRIIGRMDQQYADLVVRQVHEVLPRILQELRIAPFPIKRTETQLTASNDGEFFKIHSDTGFGETHTRSITYVYYLYREPKPFTGGELRVYDTILVDNCKTATLSFQTVVPRQNQIVFFSSCLQHEVLPVYCPSRQFADSRFTVNGWLHRYPEEDN